MNNSTSFIATYIWNTQAKHCAIQQIVDTQDAENLSICIVMQCNVFNNALCDDLMMFLMASIPIWHIVNPLLLLQWSTIYIQIKEYRNQLHNQTGA